MKLFRIFVLIVLLTPLIAEARTPFEETGVGNVQMVPTTPNTQAPQVNTGQPVNLPLLAQSPDSSSGKTHKVVSGDTLWKIAQKYFGDGSKYNKIIEANKSRYPSLVSNPNLIQVGWTFDIPSDTAAASAPLPTQPQGTSAMSPEIPTTNPTTVPNNSGWSTWNTTPTSGNTASNIPTTTPTTQIIGYDGQGRPIYSNGTTANTTPQTPIGFDSTGNPIYNAGGTTDSALLQSLSQLIAAIVNIFKDDKNTTTSTTTATQAPIETYTNVLTSTYTNIATGTATGYQTYTNVLTSTNVLTNTFTNALTVTYTNLMTATQTMTYTAALTATNVLTNTYTSFMTNTYTNLLTYTGTSTSTSTGAQAPTSTSANTVTGTSTSTNTGTVIIKNMPIGEKRDFLQKAVNELIIQIAPVGGTVPSFTPQVVDEMIKRNILTHEDWMALNPPEGYRWELIGNSLTLVPASFVLPGTGTSAQAPTGTAVLTFTAIVTNTGTGSSTGTSTQAPSDTAVLTFTAIVTNTGTGVSTGTGTQAPSTAAQANYTAAITELGVADLLAFPQSTYSDAIRNAIPLLPIERHTHSSPLAPFLEVQGPYCLYTLEQSLLEAQKEYEKAVVEDRVTKNKWTFWQPTIEEAAQKVEQHKKRLSEAFTKFSEIFKIAQMKAQVAQGVIDQTTPSLTASSARLAELKANPKPENAAEITKLIKEVKDYEKVIQVNQEKVIQFIPLQALFPTIQ
ncbi:MAG: LysM peptidoglycan-binding domain-containing protein [Candidatus Riflebacteria bacterium]|nr:LysM peptidoglycan-binding domain-containing protein [Candidatus Riflebacteria bacterium]